MNLTSLFNFNYLKENLKKSRSTILLCTFLVPIINLIIYLMRATNNTYFIPDFMSLSNLLVVFLYILPFILSITLFSFVYKRESSDFVMSMPITKKQIFITNTFGGIIIILSMLLFNCLLIGVSSLIFSNIFIDYKMLLDLFLVWSVSYIFVFTCSNIAISVSGNKITTFIVFLLLLFLIPFMHSFIFSNSFRKDRDTKFICESEECTPKYYYCNDTKCEIQKSNGIYDVYYKKVDNDNYTLPYEFVKISLFSEEKFDLNLSVLKMAILSILYIIIGTILFNRKKFETFNTSFKNENVHLFIRSLTLIPFVCIIYSIISFDLNSYDFFTVLLLVVILCAYLIIYDLITKRKISKVWKSMVYSITTILIIVFIGIVMDNKDIILKDKDILHLGVSSSSYDSHILSSGKSSDRELINYVISIFLSNESLIDDLDYQRLKISVDTKNKGEYSFEIFVNEEEYDYIMTKLSEDDDYKKTSRYAKGNDVFAISLYDNVIYLDKSNDLYGKLVSKLDGDYKRSDPSSIFNVSMYVYDDYTIKTVDINIDNDKELCEKILNLFNSETKKATLKDNFNIDYYFVNDRVYYIYNKSDEYYKLSKFVIDNVKENVSINSDYEIIRFRNYSDNGNYILVTNKVDELNSIIENMGDNDEESTSTY